MQQREEESLEREVKTQYVCIFKCALYLHMCTLYVDVYVHTHTDWVCICICILMQQHEEEGLEREVENINIYGVASVSRINQIIGLFCKRAL